MNSHSCENPSHSGTPTQDNLELGPTNALTVNTQKLIDAATKFDIRHCVGSQSTGSLLKIEFKMHKLEEQIIIGRQMLAVNEGDPIEIQRYITAASTVYNRHLTKMLELPNINAKTKRPPNLPIMFSVEETSELYWTLVHFGNIKSVVTQVERGLQENMSRLLKMPHTRPEEHNAVFGGVRLIAAALRQWRYKAEAAVHGRCIAIQSMISAKMTRESLVEAQDDGSCVIAEETSSSQNSSVETIMAE